MAAQSIGETFCIGADFALDNHGLLVGVHEFDGSSMVIICLFWVLLMKSIMAARWWIYRFRSGPVTRRAAVIIADIAQDWRQIELIRWS